jgi:hypothetical protein
MSALLPRRIMLPPQGDVSRLLPHEARERLRAAYCTEPHLPLGESDIRMARIERVTCEIRAAYPHLYREVTARTS